MYWKSVLRQPKRIIIRNLGWRIVEASWVSIRHAKSSTILGVTWACVLSKRKSEDTLAFTGSSPAKMSIYLTLYPLLSESVIQSTVSRQIKCPTSFKILPGGQETFWNRYKIWAFTSVRTKALNKSRSINGKLNNQPSFIGILSKLLSFRTEVWKRLEKGRRKNLSIMHYYKGYQSVALV